MALRNEFNYRTLTKNVKQIKREPRALIDTFTRKGKAIPTRVVDTAKLTGKVKMAPFCQRRSSGKAVGRRKMKIEYEIFPDIRLFTPFTDDDVESMSIMYPEYYKVPALMKQLKEKINDQQAEFKNMIYYRIEWMFAKMISAGEWEYDDGRGTVYNIDYKMPDDNKMDANTVWSDAAAKPIDDLDRMVDQAGESFTGPGNLFLFGPQAWNEFKSHTNVLNLLNNRRVDIGNITSAGNKDILRKVGRYDDNDLYVYRAKDDQGNYLIPTNKVCHFNSRLDLWYDFGRVPEPKYGNACITDFFSKTYSEENPAAEIILVHSCPLALCADIESVVNMDT